MEPDSIHAYLLRGWQETNTKKGWRFRIRNIQTGEQFGFNDLESLQRFLKKKFKEQK